MVEKCADIQCSLFVGQSGAVATTRADSYRYDMLMLSGQISMRPATWASLIS